MQKIQSLSQQIYGFIVDEIRFGNLALGQKIDEGELISKLSTSRTPIREALIQLSADGILVNVPRKGFFVKDLNEKTLRDVTDIIACLDFYGLKKAIPQLQDEDYVHMYKIIDEVDSAIEERDYSKYCLLTDRFHGYYYHASGNESLPATITSIENQCVRHTYFNQDQEKLYGTLKEVNQEHRKILELAAKNDLPALEKLIFFHWTKIVPGMW